MTFVEANIRALIIEASAIETRIRVFEAENKHRETEGQAPAYGAAAFEAEANTLSCIAEQIRSFAPALQA